MEDTSQSRTADGTEQALYRAGHSTSQIFTDGKGDGIHNAADNARRNQKSDALLGKQVSGGIQYAINPG